MWREAIGAYLRHGICLEGLTETPTTLSQDIRFSGRCLNPGPSGLRSRTPNYTTAKVFQFCVQTQLLHFLEFLTSANTDPIKFQQCRTSFYCDNILFL